MSLVWQFFVRTADDNVCVCRVCPIESKFRVVKGCNGSTSNLLAHLRRHHPVEMGVATQMKMNNEKVLIELPAERACAIDYALGELFSTEYLPISLIENDRFKRFVGVLNPAYKVPSTPKLLEIMKRRQRPIHPGQFQQHIGQFHIGYGARPEPGPSGFHGQMQPSISNPVLRVKEEEMDEDLEFVESPNQRLEMLQQWAEAGPMPSEKEDAAANSRAAECSQTNEVVVNNEQVQGIKTLSPEPSPSSSAHYHPYSPKPALPSSSTQFEVKEQPNLPTSSLNNLVVKSEEQQQQQPVDARASILADLVRQQGLRLLASDPKKFDTFWTDVIMAVAKSN